MDKEGRKALIISLILIIIFVSFLYFIYNVALVDIPCICKNGSIIMTHRLGIKHSENYCNESVECRDIGVRISEIEKWMQS